MASELNYDFLEARPVTIRPTQSIELWVVGCGGTGSFLVQLLCRIVQQLMQQDKAVKLVLVDPDIVEPKNLTRQCFCPAEVGLNKAHALAARYGTAWGLPIQAIDQPFDRTHLSNRYSSLTILLGCVDNAKARIRLAKTLEFNRNDAPNLWWIDGGNGDRFGQVLVGSSLSPLPQDYAFSELGCIWLPAPSVQAPELLIAKPDELEASPLSCAERSLLNVQGVMVNPQTAVVMADLTLDLLRGQLKRFAVSFDQQSGAMTSRYTTQGAIEAAVKPARSRS